MKKINPIIVGLLCVLLMFACVACANKKTDVSEQPEEIVIPEGDEISAASAVEKIINDEDLIDTEMEGAFDEDEEAVSLKLTNIYYVQGNYDEFKIEECELEAITAENLIACLARHNIVPASTSVEACSVWVTDSGEKVVTLVLSNSFDDYLSTMSEKAETAILASIANTFIEAFDVDILHFEDRDLTWCDTPGDILD